MPLEMRKTSQWWYGRYNAGGKVHCVNLRVAIEGERPESVTQDGNRKFERSRGKAQGKLDEMIAEAKAKRDSSEYVQKLHEIRTGRRIGSIPLASLAQEWDALPRKRKVEPGYVQTAKARFERFAAFVKENFPKAATLADVTPEMGLGFMQHEEKAGLSSRTWNGVLALMKSAFRKMAHKGNVVANPFDGIPTKDMDTVHRKPFTQEELRAILTAARDDEFTRPIFVTGIFTAMRRGDCCMLRWTDVDLRAGFVRVKTSKTGETVEIPMFPLFREELERHMGNGSEFVFPEQAAMYQRNDDGITHRVRRVFEAAGFYDLPDQEDEEATSGKAAKKERPVCRGEVTAKRGTGLRRASVRDFHSFRVTWITLALAAGVPMELVTRVTGHQTVDVVLKHYFRPGREDFRRTLENAMPRLFQEPAAPKALPPVSAPESRRDEVATVTRVGEAAEQEPATPAAMIGAAVDALEKMTVANWMARRDEALEALRGVAG